MPDLKPFALYEEISDSDQAAFAVLARVRTQLGEMPFYPKYGSDTDEQLDAPDSKGVAIVKASIAQALNGTIPGVKLIAVVLQLVDSTYKFSISFAYDDEEYTVTA